MNKADLIDSVAQDTDMSKASATRAVDSVIDNITGSLKSGDQVTLVAVSYTHLTLPTKRIV